MSFIKAGDMNKENHKCGLYMLFLSRFYYYISRFHIIYYPLSHCFSHTTFNGTERIDLRWQAITELLSHWTQDYKDTETNTLQY